MTPARTDSRDRIIDAAMELFAYQGYGPTGLAEIARRAEVQSGSLYHFFPTKEELLAAVLKRRRELLWPEVLQPIWDRFDDPLERIFKLLDQYRLMLQMTEFAHGCPIGNLALELTESHPNSRDLIAGCFTDWMKAIEQCFLEAARRLPEEVDPKRLAVFVLTTMEGAVMLARTYRDFRAYDAAVVSLREYIDALIERETSWGDRRSPPAAARRRRS